MKKLLWVFLIIPIIGFAINPFTKNTIKTSKSMLADPTPEEILKKHLSTVLGNTKLETIKDIELIGTGSIMNQPAEMVTRYILNSDFSTKINIGTFGTVMMMGKVNNDYIAKQQGTDIPLDDKIKEGLNEQTYYFTEQFLLEAKGYSFKLIGTDNIDGKEAYNVEITSPTNKTTNIYYDKSSGLKLREITSDEGKTNIVNLNDYKNVNGILFPSKISIDPGQGFTFDLEFKTIKVNSGLKVDDLK